MSGREEFKEEEGDGMHQPEEEGMVGGGCKRRRSKIKRAMCLLFLPLRKLEKLHIIISSSSSSSKRKEKEKKRSPPPPPPPFPYAEDLGGRTGGCYLCFMQPPPASSPLSAEPNNNKRPPSSYYDFVKSMIEKNDFYSPECNVHHPYP